MRILQVTNFFKPSFEAGGVARVAYDVSRSLLKNNHEITVFTTNRSGANIDVKANRPLNVEGMKVYYFENLRKYFPVLIVPIPYYLPIIARKEIQNFDIIHIHEHRTLLAIIVHRYAKKYNIPYVLQSHGSVLPILQKQKFKKIFDSFFGYNILKDASRVIALNETEAFQYQKIGVDKNKIEIVPNGIDLSEYENLPVKGIFRNKYGIRTDEKIVLYLARINPIKGGNLLVEAFSDLITKIEKVKLVIAGPDDGFLPTLKEKIKVLDIGDKTVFTGPLYGRDKLEAYVDGDVYVLPSVYETFPVTVLEACACGVPVIVTDRCGIADIVSDKVGYVVSYDEIELSKAIFNILNDDSSRTRFSNEAKCLIETTFSMDSVIKKIDIIYKKICRVD